MRILVAGGEGQLGSEFGPLAGGGVEIVACGRSVLDITNPASIARALEAYQPDALVNAAAYTAVDKAETEREAAFAINATGPAHLAAAAAQAGIPLVHVSTDYVFDGQKPVPEAYTETDECNPRTVYGQSKREGELRVLAACPQAYIVRTSWVFGLTGGNFPKTMIRLARERDVLRVVADQWGCPTFSTDIANIIIQIIASREIVPPGIYHYAGQQPCTWYDFACAIVERAARAGVISRGPRVEPIGTADYPVPAPRPANSILSSGRLLSYWARPELACDWAVGLDRLISSCKV